MKKNLNEWCNEYLRIYKSGRLKKSTLMNYYDNAKHVPDYLDIDCTALDLQRLINQLHESGLSVSTIKHVLTVIRQALNKAAQLGMIDKLPLYETLELPFDERKEVEAFTQSEINRLGRLLTEPGRYNDFFLLLLYTGLRVGEALALRWSDISLRKHSLTVMRTDYRGLIQHPKTKRGLRTIPLCAEARFILRRRREMYSTDDVIFPFSYYAVYNAFQTLCKRAEVVPRGVHALRHTYATFALRCGVNVKTLSSMLGHAGVQITLDTYCSVELEDKQKEADKINFFSRTLSPHNQSVDTVSFYPERLDDAHVPGDERLIKL